MRCSHPEADASWAPPTTHPAEVHFSGHTVALFQCMWPRRLAQRLTRQRMLSIGKLANGQANYYLDLAGERVDRGSSVATGVEDYYVGGAEPPGRWTGDLANEVGLEGEVKAETLKKLLEEPAPPDGFDQPPIIERRAPAIRSCTPMARVPSLTLTKVPVNGRFRRESGPCGPRPRGQFPVQLPPGPRRIRVAMGARYASRGDELDLQLEFHVELVRSIRQTVRRGRRSRRLRRSANLSHKRRSLTMAGLEATPLSVAVRSRDTVVLVRRTSALAEHGRVRPQAAGLRRACLRRERRSRRRDRLANRERRKTHRRKG